MRKSGFSKRGFTQLPKRVKHAVVVVSDGIMISLACPVALLLAHGDLAALSNLLPSGLIIPLLAVFLLKLLGVYQHSIRYPHLRVVLSVAASILLATTIWGAALLSFFPQARWNLHWNEVALIALAGMTLTAVSRLIAGWVLAETQARHRKQPVFIYGAGRAGSMLAPALIAGGRYQPIGFLDDAPEAQGRALFGLKVHPPSSTFLAALEEMHGANTVLLAMPSANHQELIRVTDHLTAAKLHVKQVPALEEIMSGARRITDVRDIRIEDLLGRDAIEPLPELLSRDVVGRVVMVTGAGGSIGSELARQCLNLLPSKLILLDKSELALYQIERELRNSLKATRHEAAAKVQVVPALGSILNESWLDQIVAQHCVETIYHAAAYKHVPLIEENSGSGVRNNVFGTLCALRVAAARKVKAFVMISTDKAVRPTNVMGASKRVAELVAQAFDQLHPELRIAIVRFGNVLGSSGSVVPLFREQIAQGGPVTVTHTDVTRYFMTIPEAAQLVIQAGAMGQGRQVFLLDMGAPIRIMDLARRMIDLAGLSIRDADNPEGDIELAITGLRAGEKLYEELLIDADAQITEHPRIHSAEEDHLTWAELSPKLERLLDAARGTDEIAMRGELLRLVPEFHPGIAVQEAVGQSSASGKVAAHPRPKKSRKDNKDRRVDQENTPDWSPDQSTALLID